MERRTACCTIEVKDIVMLATVGVQEAEIILSRKEKTTPKPAQGSLWDEAFDTKEREKGHARPPRESSTAESRDHEKTRLVQELEEAKRELSRLQARLEEAGPWTGMDISALHSNLLEWLPALLLVEFMKATALKETKQALKRIKPTAGLPICTSLSVKKIGSRIGLTPSQSEKALTVLSSFGCVTQRIPGLLDVGKFTLNERGRVVPSWYLSLEDTDKLLGPLFSVEPL